jgi:hypothetical protein
MRITNIRRKEFEKAHRSALAGGGDQRLDRSGAATDRYEWFMLLPPSASASAPLNV